MFAFRSIRFALIRDWFSRLSIMIGVLGLGQDCLDFVFVFENIFSSCFIC